MSAGIRSRSGRDFPSLAGVLIPDARVAVVDVVPNADLQNYVRASGVQLPFRDGAFDLVCSLDTLEHIPREHRPAFLSELLRVTRDGLYVAFPFDSAQQPVGGVLSSRVHWCGADAVPFRPCWSTANSACPIGNP